MSSKFRIAAAALLLAVSTAGQPAGPGAVGDPGRFTIFQPPAGQGESAGEPTLGFNPRTNRAMYIAGVETLRVTFPEKLGEPLPEACPALWEDVSFATTEVISFDPIIFTDTDTGRTFASQLLVAAGESAFAFTDDDGATWTPSPATLTGGIDHQSVGGGPGKLVPGTPLYPNKVYYCSQSIVQSFCIRSDDGGMTFGPPTSLSGAGQGCTGSIHGHIKVDHSGTVYVPLPGCSAGERGQQQGVMVSENDGLTWAGRAVTGSSAKSSNNPALAIASDDTIYFCYQNREGQTRAAVSHDKGVTWENDTDLSSALGLTITEFQVAAAGDPDRAACGFLGSTGEGNSTALDYEGIWYPFVAVTYDGGKTWTTTNVSPDDPVQGAGGIWEGGGGPLDRNLLDFNDMDIDEQGRVLFTYADGCMGGCRLDPSGGSYSAKATIARQSGGKTLLAAFDKPDGAPAAACLEGGRDASQALLRWRAPDNGGQPITGYRIYRGASADDMAQVAEVDAEDRAHSDTDAGAETAYYSVAAVSAAGEGARSNAVQLAVGELPMAESACVVPGLTVIRDPAGDPRSRAPLHDLVSVSLAEPLDMEGKLVVTLKIASLPQPSPSSLYEARFPIDSDNAFFIGMETTQVMPRFVYGTIAVTTAVVTSASDYTIQGTLDPASNYNADGTITLVVDKALLAEHFDTAPGKRLVIGGFVRALAGDPAGLSGTSFDPTTYAAYFLREADCSSLSQTEPELTAVATPAAQAPVEETKQTFFGGALGLALLAGLLGIGLRRRS